MDKIKKQIAQIIANREKILHSLNSFREFYNKRVVYITLNIDCEVRVFDSVPQYINNRFVEKRKENPPIYQNSIFTVPPQLMLKDSHAQIILHPLVMCALLYVNHIDKVEIDFAESIIRIKGYNEILEKETDVTYPSDTTIFFYSTRTPRLPLEFCASINLLLTTKLFGKTKYSIELQRGNRIIKNCKSNHDESKNH